MAKIVLNVQSDTKQAIKSIGELSAKIEEVSSAYSKMSAKAQNAQIREEKLATQKAKTAVEAAKEQVQLAKVNVELAKQATQMARTEKVQRTTVSSVERLQKKYADLLNTIKSIENRYPAGTFDALKNSVNQNLQATKNLTEGSEELEKEYVKLAAQVSTVRAETEKNTTAVVQNGDSIASLAKKFVLWQFAATAVMKPIQLLRSAIASINTTLVETEDRVVELQRVAGQAANASELYKLAEKMGQSFDNASEAVLRFARRGMSWTESLKAAEAALLATNVAELTVEQSTDGLGAIMAQFNKEASELTNVVDMLNKTADNFPVTTEKILAALQRVGSTASVARLSLEETIGLITTLSKATNRSGENIGTALNSIINIAQKPATLEKFSQLSKDVAAVVDKFNTGKGSILEVLQAVSTEIQKLDVGEILSDEEFNNLNDELKESLGEDFEILSDIYGTAGTYRRNYFIALLNDLDTVKEVQGEIATANGYSAKENEQYLNTYSAKLNSLKAQWQDFVNDEQGLLGLKKLLVDLGSGTLNLVKSLGGLKTVLLEVAIIGATILATTKGAAIAEGIRKVISLLRTLTVDALPNAVAAWKSYAAGVTSANTAIQASIPIIGLLLVAITAITSAIISGVKASERARQEILENYKAEKTRTQQLRDLYNEYNRLNSIINKSEEENKSLETVEQSIVNILKDKYEILGNLTQGTNEYTESIKNLTAAELAQSEIGLIDAVDVAEKNLSKLKIGRKGGQYGALNSYYGAYGGTELVKSILDNKGLSSSQKGRFLDLRDDARGNNITDQLYNYAQYKKGFDALYEAYSQALVNGDTQTAKSITQSTAWKNFKEAIEDSEDVINSYFDTKVNYLALQYQRANGQVTTTEDYKELQAWITAQIGAGEFYDDTINSILAGIVKIKQETQSTTADTKKRLEDIKDKDLPDIVKQLKTIRDQEKESLELEERKQKVLDAQTKAMEAQQALEAARNARGVLRVGESGRLEVQQDEKAIAEAQEKADKAQEDYQNSIKDYTDWVKDKAWNSVIEELQDGNATNQSVLKLLADFVDKGMIEGIQETQKTPEWLEQIITAIKDTTKVDLTEEENYPPVEEGKYEEPQPQPHPPSSSDTPSTSGSATPNYAKNAKVIEGAKGYNISADKIGDNGYIEWNGHKYRIEGGGNYANDSELKSVAESLGLKDRDIFAYNGEIYGMLDGGIVKIQARPAMKSGYNKLTSAIKDEYGSLGETNFDDILTTIMTPVPDSSFNKNINGMGLMYSDGTNYVPAPKTISTVGGTTNNTYNNGTTLNGVKIGSDLLQRPFIDVLEYVDLVPNHK